MGEVLETIAYVVELSLILLISLGGLRFCLKILVCDVFNTITYTLKKKSILNELKNKTRKIGHEISFLLQDMNLYEQM